jgi:hypothetical protein
VAEISLGQLTVAADKQRRVDMQLEVEPELLRGLWLARGLEHPHQRLGGAELLGAGLVAQPVAAGLARGGVGQPHAPPAAVHAREHLAGLPP